MSSMRDNNMVFILILTECQSNWAADWKQGYELRIRASLS
jgi:hypothetical protein